MPQGLGGGSGSERACANSIWLRAPLSSRSVSSKAAFTSASTSLRTEATAAQPLQLSSGSAEQPGGIVVLVAPPSWNQPHSVCMARSCGVLRLAGGAWGLCRSSQGAPVELGLLSHEALQLLEYRHVLHRAGGALREPSGERKRMRTRAGHTRTCAHATHSR